MTVDGRRLVTVAVCVALIALLIWLIYQAGREREELPPGLAVAPSAADLSEEAARQMASRAVMAFCTVNYGQPQEWLARFAEISTDDVYALLRDQIQPAIWPAFAEAKLVSAAHVSGVQKLAEGVDAVAHRRWQVWQVTATVDRPWPNLEVERLGPFTIPWPRHQGFSTYVTVLEGDGRWRFGLFPAEEIVLAAREAKP
jgi:hypothetical protein